MADDLTRDLAVSPRPAQELTLLHRELAVELATAGWSNAKIAKMLSLPPALAALLPPLTALAADLARTAGGPLG